MKKQFSRRTFLQLLVAGIANKNTETQLWNATAPTDSQTPAQNLSSNNDDFDLAVTDEDLVFAMLRGLLPIANDTPQAVVQVAADMLKAVLAGSPANLLTLYKAQLNYNRVQQLSSKVLTEEQTFIDLLNAEHSNGTTMIADMMTSFYRDVIFVPYFYQIAFQYGLCEIGVPSGNWENYDQRPQPPFTYTGLDYIRWYSRGTSCST